MPVVRKREIENLEQLSGEELQAFIDSLPAQQHTISDLLDFIEDELYDTECNHSLQLAMRFMMENRTVLGEEAVALGMCGEVVDDDRFAERLAAYCQELCAWSPITLRLLKRGMVSAVAGTDMEQQLRMEVGNIRIAFSSEDAKEARQAFFEKRKPVFSGK